MKRDEVKQQTEKGNEGTVKEIQKEERIAVHKGKRQGEKAGGRRKRREGERNTERTSCCST